MKILVPIFILALVAVAPFEASARDPFALPGRETVETQGVYSGVLIADQSAAPDALVTAEDVQRTEALGLFTLGVPSTGLAVGNVVIFSRGRVFEGSITGFADPDGGNLFAVISSFFNFGLSIPNPDGGFDSIDVSASAKGVMTAQIRRPAFDRTSLGSTTRITGTASLDFSDGQVDAEGADIITRTIPFIVSGVRQSQFFEGTGGIEIPDIES